MSTQPAKGTTDTATIRFTDVVGDAARACDLVAGRAEAEQLGMARAGTE